MEVVFLAHLRLSAVVVGVEDGSHRAVLVQRGISRTIRSEGRQFEVLAHVDGCRSPKERTSRA